MINLVGTEEGVSRVGKEIKAKFGKEVSLAIYGRLVCELSTSVGQESAVESSMCGGLML